MGCCLGHGNSLVFYYNMDRREEHSLFNNMPVVHTSHFSVSYS